MNTLPMKRELRYAGNVVSLLTFWSVAAILVVAADLWLEATSAGGCLAAKVSIIALVAGVYMRWGVRAATMEHAIFTGVVWTLAAMLAEMIAVTRYGTQWYALLGSPAEGALRNILLLTWIGAPALFARRRS